jgi:hypothetical protein
MDEGEMTLLELVGKLIEQNHKVIKKIRAIGAQGLFSQYLNEGNIKRPNCTFKYCIAVNFNEYGESKYSN